MPRLDSKMFKNKNNSKYIKNQLKIKNFHLKSLKNKIINNEIKQNSQKNSLNKFLFNDPLQGSNNNLKLKTQQGGSFFSLTYNNHIPVSHFKIKKNSEKQKE